MNRQLFKVCAVLVFFSCLCLTSAGSQHGEGNKHGLSVKQYEDFHDVLHPLEHEALPKGDFARIRSQAALLGKRGNAIVKLGVPAGVTAANRDAFATGLTKFKDALANRSWSCSGRLAASANAFWSSSVMILVIYSRSLQGSRHRLVANHNSAT